MAEVTLKISSPSRVFAEVKADKIVVPAMKGDLTVLPSRAPLSLLLRNGQVKLLSQDNRVTSRYFVQGGVMNTAADVCQIVSPRMEEYDGLDIAKVRQALENAKTQEDKDYYQTLLDELEMFGKVK